MNKILVLLPVISLVVSLGLISAYAQSDPIPNDPIPKWIKGVASFWVEDKITDAEFIEALEFLINQNIIKIEDKNINVKDMENIKINENVNESHDQLASCIDLELSGLGLIKTMIDHTNSKNLSPNSLNANYPDSLLDEMSSIAQQQFLHGCVDLLVPIYLDQQVKNEGSILINHVIDSINSYGFAEPELCSFDPRCSPVMSLNKNSVLQDIVIIVLFLKIDLLIL